MKDQPDLKTKIVEAGEVIVGLVKQFRDCGLDVDQAMNAAMNLYHNATCPNHAQHQSPMNFNPNDPESVCELLKRASVPWGVAREAASMLEEMA